MSTEVNMNRIYAAQTNMMLIMKTLYQKRDIGDETVNPCIVQCLAERAEQQQQLKRSEMDFDADRPILYTAMKLNVLTELELITDEIDIRRICIECDGIVMAKELDLKDSHMFLGITLLSLSKKYRIY